jgi:hypothetical protein
VTIKMVGGGGPLPDPDIPRPLKALCIAAWAIGFCGLLGLGYYEHEQWFSSSRTPTATLRVASDFKGETRFISQTDARICDISTWMAVGGGGTFASLALVTHWLDHKRRLKQKS